jgi:hypothetical protein
MKQKKNIEILIYVLFPMIIGIIIYLTSRSNSIIFLKFLNLSFKKIDFAHWIKYNLVDGLWAFSISMLIQIIWDWKLNLQSLFWLIVVFLISIFLEFKIGTFDIKDLIFIILGLFIPFVLTLLININNNNYEQKII